MEQITITRDAFHEAVLAATKKVTEDVSANDGSPMATLLVPMTGMMFTKEVEHALFGDEEEG